MAAILAALALLASTQTPQAPALPPDGAIADLHVVKQVSMKYLAYLPEDYAQNRRKRYPLILFLHGSGERGNDVDKVRVHGPMKETGGGRKLPYVIIEPQCPEGSWWDPETLTSLLNQIERKYRIDKDREYLTGLSMGGYGSWALAIAQPTRFAAVAICCGGGDPTKVSVLKDIPVWVTHGDADGSVPLQQDVNMVEALRRAGGNVKFDIIKGGQHDIWSDFYGKSDVFEWFLKFKRSKNAAQ